MTIRPGETWGVPEEAPADVLWQTTDRGLGRELDGPVSASLGIRGGDLVRITGHTTTAMTLRAPIDVLRVRFVEEGTHEIRSTHAVSWIQIGSWWSRSDFFVCSNTGLVDGVEWFPRAHPNDGFLDGATIDSEMPLRQRFLARRRILKGASYAHPLIRMVRGTRHHWSGPATSLVVDGERIARVTAADIEVIPDAVTVYIGSPSTPA